MQSTTLSQIDIAVQIAGTAHAGQLDKDGNPVILHPLTVGMAGNTELEMVVGFLHDVVEDTDFSFEDLLEMGISVQAIETLKLLTHSKDTPYEEYIDRIITSGNQTAINVKLNDLTHNLKRGRAGGHTEIVKKHEKAYARFIEATKKGNEIRF